MNAFSDLLWNAFSPLTNAVLPVPSKIQSDWQCPEGTVNQIDPQFVENKNEVRFNNLMRISLFDFLFSKSSELLKQSFVIVLGFLNTKLFCFNIQTEMLGVYSSIISKIFANYT